MSEAGMPVAQMSTLLLNNAMTVADDPRRNSPPSKNEELITKSEQ